MNVRIVDTTDGKYIGFSFDTEDNPIVLKNEQTVFVEKKIKLSDSFLFINSNYIIEAKEDK